MITALCNTFPLFKAKGKQRKTKKVHYSVAHHVFFSSLIFLRVNGH